MGNIIRIIGSKKQNFGRTMVFAISIMFFFLAFLQMEPAIRSRNYTSVPGYISDVTLGYMRGSRGNRPKYDYVVHWFYEGQEYRKKQSSLTTPPDTSISEVWINSDNTDMSLYKSSNLSRQSVSFALLGVAFFAIWIVMFKRSENVPYNSDIPFDIFVHSIFIIVLDIIALLIGYASYKYAIETDNLNQLVLSKGIIGLCVIIMISSGVLIILAKREMNRMG